jgi:hypothetical protein
MRINSKLGVQHATFDGKGAGEGLAIFFSQGALDVSRYRFLVKAITDEGTFQVGSFFSSPPIATTPNGQLTRMLASAVCPGATGWAVDISCADLEIAPETADVHLVSSKCCTAPVGVTRVGQRYSSLGGNSLGGADTVIVPAGRTVTGVSAIAPAGAGAIDLGTGAALISIPTGFTANAEPQAPFIGYHTMILTNVEYFIEYLESA